LLNLSGIAGDDVIDQQAVDIFKPGHAA